jgi:hypothetical protein
MFKTVMIILVAINVLGWIAYGIWQRRQRIEQQKHPQKKTEHLDEVRKSFEDYAKKLKEFEKPPHKKQ